MREARVNVLKRESLTSGIGGGSEVNVLKRGHLKPSALVSELLQCQWPHHGICESLTVAHRT